MRRSTSSLAAAVLLASLLPGCFGGDRPPLGQVQGRVTMDGAPLAGVIISFQPKEGRAATAVTDADGRYDLVYIRGVKGAKIGPNTVSFAWPTGDEAKSVIPDKFSTASILKREVKSSNDPMDFNIETK